ncbi:MAG: hypothetical protein O7D32_01710 [bacterium]|nr:hypothetical protein [bacterium]
MDRKKPPVLTSPWKMGFFVWLMMLVVSVGVPYLMPRIMEVTWAWSDFAVWKEAFTGKGALFALVVQLFPVIALVSIVSMLTYFLITSAARKYKKYLDSGQDYRRLLATIREIDDIRNESKINRLKNHPELRNFLMNVRENVDEKIKAVEAKEKSLEKNADDVTSLMREKLASDCKKAIKAQETGLTPDYDMPEIKKLVDALTKGAGAEASDVADRVGEIAREASDSKKNAKDIESQINGIAEMAGDGGGAQGWLNAQREFKIFVTNVEHLDKLSASLDALTEETKGVAISQALLAGSGKGTPVDMIQFAEELKEIAAKYSEMARSYVELSGEMRAAVSKIEVGMGQAMAHLQSGTDTDHSIGAVAAKVSLWVERVVILVDKIESLHRSAQPGLTPASKESPMDDMSGLNLDTPRESASDSDDFSFESLDRVSVDPADSARIQGFEGSGGGMGEATLGSGSIADDDMFADLKSDQRIDSEAAAPAASVSDPPQPPPAPSVAEEYGALELDSDSPPDFGGELPAEDDGVIDLYVLGAVDYDPVVHQ